VSDLALKHIRHLAGIIGPRGSCTPQERRAAEYCRQVLTDLGVDARLQPFRAPRSGWAPFSIGSALMLTSVLAFVPTSSPNGRGAAAALALAVTASLFLQLTFRPNPLAWLVPKGPSQNVFAVIAPRSETRRTVVVVGHVDTHRTPWAMASPLAFRLFQSLITIGVAAFALLAALFIVGVRWPAMVPTPLVVVAAVIVSTVFIVTLQPEFSPCVPGANDNASGAAATLALAARLTVEPLENTRVWVLASGAEEVEARGPVHLLREHPELKNADWLVLDTIAGPGAGPCLITAEHVLVPLRADSELLRAARTVAAAHADLGAYEHYYRGLFSEHSPLTAAGRRSLAIINFRKDGVLPNWHRPTDTVENVDPDVLDRTERFVWALLQHLDAEA
jgi:hypothetical protein